MSDKINGESKSIIGDVRSTNTKAPVNTPPTSKLPSPPAATPPPAKAPEK